MKIQDHPKVKFYHWGWLEHEILDRKVLWHFLLRCTIFEISSNLETSQSRREGVARVALHWLPFVLIRNSWTEPRREKCLRTFRCGISWWIQCVNIGRGFINCEICDDASNQTELSTWLRDTYSAIEVYVKGILNSNPILVIGPRAERSISTFSCIVTLPAKTYGWGSSGRLCFVLWNCWKVESQASPLAHDSPIWQLVEFTRFKSLIRN